MGIEVSKTPLFTTEGIGNFVAFSGTLRRIHARLMVEGYRIEGRSINKKPLELISQKKKPIYNQVK